MPEHVHLLISEPESKTIARVIQALKVSVVRNTAGSGALWQKRYYDHNVRHYKSFMQAALHPQKPGEAWFMRERR